MAQNTEYGKTIKKKLVDLGRTNTWLCEEVAAKTSSFFDSAYLSRICRGERTPILERGVAAINEILGIDEQAVSEHAVSAEGED